MVATPLITFLLPIFAVSKAAIMTFYIFMADSGTQRVLPLFAIIWSRILVAMLLKFFFLKVPSVAIWQTILFVSKHFYLIFLYCPLSWFGIKTRHILQSSFSAALYTQSSMAWMALLLSKSPAHILTPLKSILSRLEVSSNNLTISPTSELLKYTIPTLSPCLPA